LKELPEAERFTQLRTSTKHFVDTIKLIAYRAETGWCRWCGTSSSGPTTHGR